MNESTNCQPPHDRRAVRTQKALKRVMLELLDKKDISKITVSELAALADIGRGTFYLHYKDPYDLLDKLEDELLKQITAHTPLDIESGDDWLLVHLENIWDYIYNNKETFKIMMNYRNKGRFIEKIRQTSGRDILKKYQGDLDNLPDYYAAIYVISGTLGIFLQWMEDGMPIPPDILAKVVKKIVIG